MTTRLAERSQRLAALRAQARQARRQDPEPLPQPLPRLPQPQIDEPLPPRLENLVRQLLQTGLTSVRLAPTALGASVLATVLNDPHLMQIRNLERVYRALEAMGLPAMRSPATMTVRPELGDLDRYVISFLGPRGEAGRIIAPQAAPRQLILSMPGSPVPATAGSPRNILSLLRSLYDYRRLRRLESQLRNWRPPARP
ncbi:MAG: hypothetical protein QN162_15320 [Armatimonadota bacterium]|nr:hypothetical protein [Armatimonadota bacterium]